MYNAECFEKVFLSLLLLQAPEQVPRKPRVRTPKVEKIKTLEEADNKEEDGAKAKGAGRRRKKPLKADVKETSDVCGEAGPPTEEEDPIAAIIEAVLASATGTNTAAEKPKRPKKVKKQGQEGNVAKMPKVDGERTANDADDNDEDDGSTAGNKGH